MKAAFILSVAGVGLFATGPVSAKTISVPEETPALTFQVPDDWAVSTSDLGVEATAPQASSIVYAKILARPKDDPNAWINAILGKFRTHGVHFLGDKEAVVTAPATGLPPSTVPPSTVPPSTVPPATSPPATSPPMAMPGGVPPVAPSSAAIPSLAIPATPAPTPLDKALAAKETAPPNTPGGPAPANPQPANPPPVGPPALAVQPPAGVPEKAADAQPPLPPEEKLGILPIIGTLAPRTASVPILNQKVGGLTMRALPYKGTTRDGTPVDVELLIYNLPDHSALFLAQESGQTDNRVVDIVNSVRPTTK